MSTHDCGSPICPLNGKTPIDAYKTAMTHITIRKAAGFEFAPGEVERIREQLLSECSESERREIEELERRLGDGN